MNNHISSLVNYYISKNYISESDAIYCTNQVASLINFFEIEYNKNEVPELYTSLEGIINYAIKNNQIENFVYEKEILESKITNIFIDRPSVIQNSFDSKEITAAYTDFYNMGVDTNYIKVNDLKRNIHYKKCIEGKPIEISINLAKPEKDPKEIEKLKHIKSTSYPKCLLCNENVGFSGSATSPARSNHRVISLSLNNQDWLFQYSPYSYYNYHCILIEKNHSNMYVTDNTIKVQLDFVDKFKNFFIGNNASLPIIGGSILNHNHFQGGIYNFPIDTVESLFKISEEEIEIEYLDWYLATLKITSKSKDKLIERLNKIRSNWEEYSNSEINIFNQQNNSLNYITRKQGDCYEVLVILRNNRTNEEFEHGIYHPTPNYFHIKKENIGLIEAMGLAILPARLIEELDDVKQFILNNKDISNSSHYDWAIELKECYNKEDIDTYIDDAVARRFVDILKCCNVLRYCNDIETIIKDIIN